MTEHKVLLVDDHPLFRKGLRSILESSDTKMIINEAKDGIGAINSVKEDTPEIIIMDITMPKLNGIEATKEILSFAPKTKILALSIHSGKRFVKGMLKAGASGYLLKDSVPEELLSAIDKIIDGDMYLSSAITNVALSSDFQQDEKEANIVQTKLQQPVIPVDFVSRTAVIEQLKLNEFKPFSLVSAPTGYGKSVAVSQWLIHTETPHTWISLNEEHNSLRVFLKYLYAAVTKIDPSALFEINNLEGELLLPSVKSIAQKLINELNEIDQKFILVFDDYHFIKNDDIHLIISELLSFPPENMHLSIITHSDPPFELNSLRINDRMNEIRMKELRFSVDEIMSLFKNTFHKEIDKKQAALEFDKTEGWVVGLKLASLNVENEIKAANETNVFSACLIEDILSKESEEIQDLLLKSSLFETFSAELLQQVFDLNENEAINFIDSLLAANLFVIPLKSDEKWYKFHPLFQKLLFAKLSKDTTESQINEYHTKASNWFLSHHFIEEAIQQALSAKESDFACEILLNNGCDKLISNLPALEEWLQLFPLELIEQHPMLLLYKAQIAKLEMKFKVVTLCLNSAEILLQNSSGSFEKEDFIWGVLHTIRSFDYFNKLNFKEGILNAKKAINLLKANNSQEIKAYSYSLLAMNTQKNGNTKKAFLIINEALEDINFQQANAQFVLLKGYCEIALFGSKFNTLKITTSKLFEIAKQTNTLGNKCDAQFYLATSFYYLNDIESCITILETILENRSSLSIQLLNDATILLALAYQTKGDITKATSTAIRYVNDIKDTAKEYFYIQGDLLLAELAYRQGKIDKAKSILQKSKNIEWNDNSIHTIYFSFELTLVKVFLAEENEGDLDLVYEELIVIENMANATNNTSNQIQITILLAVYFQIIQEDKKAKLKLNSALSLAKKGQGVRLFLDVGFPVMHLLNTFASSLKDTGFVNYILEGFQYERSVFGKEIIVSAEAKKEIRNNNIINLLSNREKEVVELVAKGMRNKEIGDVLFVSNDTVKKHLYNVYQKLDVDNRTSMVAKVKILGLLD